MLDLKLLAPVARATNAIYMYVPEPDWEGNTDTLDTITGEGYFHHGDLAGSIKVGDIIFVNADRFGILKVTEVHPGGMVNTALVFGETGEVGGDDESGEGEETGEV